MQRGADGMTVDAKGQLYVTTEMGLQICDQAGRVKVILPKPHKSGLSNAAGGGVDFVELFFTCGDTV